MDSKSKLLRDLVLSSKADFTIRFDQPTVHRHSTLEVTPSPWCLPGSVGCPDNLNRFAA